jgi:hypothetical protein
MGECVLVQKPVFQPDFPESPSHVSVEEITEQDACGALGAEFHGEPFDETVLRAQSPQRKAGAR